MSLATLIVDPEEMAAARVTVRDGRYRHLFRARRLAKGERVRIVDGRGEAAWARVDRVSSEQAELLIEGRAPSNEPIERLEIWVGIPRPRRASWLVEKATELGVVAVRWLETARGVRTLPPASMARLERVARAAVEQCQRSWIPEISGPHAWRDALAQIERVGEAWLLQPDAPAALHAGSAGQSLLLVGPEGGFNGRELDELEARGVTVLGLGSRVLRVETAAVAGAALMLCGRSSLRNGSGCDEPV